MKFALERETDITELCCLIYISIFGIIGYLEGEKKRRFDAKPYVNHQIASGVCGKRTGIAKKNESPEKWPLLPSGVSQGGPGRVSGRKEVVMEVPEVQQTIQFRRSDIYKVDNKTLQHSQTFTPLLDKTRQFIHRIYLRVAT